MHTSITPFLALVVFYDYYTQRLTPTKHVEKAIGASHLCHQNCCTARRKEALRLCQGDELRVKLWVRVEKERVGGEIVTALWVCL